MLFTLIALITLFALCIFLIKSITVVPHKHVMLLEKVGAYSRTIGAGLHLLLNPFEKQKSALWTSSNGKRVRYPVIPITTKSTMVSLKNYDLNIFYRIEVPQTAVFYEGDALYEFFLRVMHVISTTDLTLVEISDVIESINEKTLKLLGIACHGIDVTPKEPEPEIEVEPAEFEDKRRWWKFLKEEGFSQEQIFELEKEMIKK